MFVVMQLVGQVPAARQSGLLGATEKAMLSLGGVIIALKLEPSCTANDDVLPTLIG